MGRARLILAFGLVVTFALSSHAQSNTTAFVARLGASLSSGGFEVGRFDLSTNLSLAPRAAIERSWDIAYSAGGSSVCVTYPFANMVGFIDVATGAETLRSSSVGNALDPRGVASVIRNGREYCLVANQGSGTVSFFFFDTASGAWTWDFDLNVGVVQPIALAVSPDGSLLAVGTQTSPASVAVFRISADPPVSAGVFVLRDALGNERGAIRDLEFSGDGSRLFASTLFNIGFNFSALDRKKSVV